MTDEEGCEYAQLLADDLKSFMARADAAGPEFWGEFREFILRVVGPIAGVGGTFEQARAAVSDDDWTGMFEALSETNKALFREAVKRNAH